MKTPCALRLCLGLTLAGLAIAPATAQPKLTAPEVFNRHFEAAGGRAAIEKIQSVVATGRGQENSETFQFELTLKPPGLIRLVAHSDRGFAVRQGRDRQARCWRQVPEGIRDLNGQEAGELMETTLGLHLPGQIGLSGLLAQAVCEEVHDGDRTLVALGKTDPKSPFPQLLFDAKTGLLARVNKVALENYRQVEGFRLPFVIRPSAQSTLRVETVRFNVPVDDAFFDRPSDAGRQEAGAETRPAPSYQTLTSKPGQLEIVRQPRPMEFARGRMADLPRYNASAADRGWQVDVRSADLSQLDLRDRAADLEHADFDNQTRWPEKLPADFQPSRVMDLGRDPGLGVRTLHRRGITGKGIAVGVIDQTLLVNHAEYRDRLRLYEEIHAPANLASEMHGPAVASIAVGKTVGVAPEADLYYIAETHGVFGPDRQFDWDFTWLAQSIERLLEVNRTLPADRRLRVISISVGWAPSQKGFSEAMAAVAKATQDGVWVISTSLGQTHQLAFHGLGREPMADPNAHASYRPGSWWASPFWSGQRRPAPGETLLVPMDSRATASPTGPEDFVFYSNGGWSWCVPWLAGLYALACQVDPAITPERFWQEALNTGQTVQVRKANAVAELGTIADPVALIERLERNAPARLKPGL